VSDCCLAPTSVILQLYHGELISMKWWWGSLCIIPTRFVWFS